MTDPVPDDPLDDGLGLDDVLPDRPSAPDGPRLLLGPVLRWADATRATVWAETSTSCQLEVLGCRTRTFEVEGHHYAHLVVDGLSAGTDAAYEVRLDGRCVWPLPDDHRPPPRLRTVREDARLDLVFGSCRVDRPHEDPWNREPAEHPEGVGIDALQALARACQAGERPLPDLVVMLGDQVYADEGLSPKIQAKQGEKRPPDSEPRGEIADFEEYTWLYLDSWSNPDVRWLLSTVPSAMVFDDHDVRDDWNTSLDWRRKVRALPWWDQRITGAYMTYWLYQHLGNASPEAIEQEGLLRQVREDGGTALRAFAEQADEQVDGRKLSRWSYCLERSGVRIVMVDTRSGRLLEDGDRAMLSDQEWDQVEQWLTGGVTHLVVGSSLPLLLERSLHDLERWNEAVCAGAWGRRASRLGEQLRQALDMEHWASFSSSFDRLVGRLEQVARGRVGAAPATVLVLSGDVHHSYVAPLALPPDGETPASPVVQVVSSPMRNAFPRRLQRAFGFAASPVARRLMAALATSARLPAPRWEWSAQQGPLFGNMLGSLLLDGPTATLVLSRAVQRDGEPRLDEVQRVRLDGGGS